MLFLIFPTSYLSIAFLVCLSGQLWTGVSMVLSRKDLTLYILYAWVMLLCVNGPVDDTGITHVNKSWKGRFSFILVKLEMQVKTHQRSTFPPNVNYDVLEGSKNSVSAMSLVGSSQNWLWPPFLCHPVDKHSFILDHFTGRVSINVTRCKWQLYDKSNNVILKHLQRNSPFWRYQKTS